MEDSIRREAYLKGMQLKNSGLDAETIYARLEKQGYPAQLAKQVAKDVMLQRREDAINDLKPGGPMSKKYLFSKLFQVVIDWIQKLKD
jgi:hypothetical protein